MTKVKIVTDSSVTIEPEVVKEFDITVVPLSVMIDSVLYSDADLEEGEFYLHQIIGLDVIENDQKIGTIKEVLSYGPNDVWVVKRPNQNDLLLPYLKDVILNVDLEQGAVQVSVPEGLD